MTAFRASHRPSTTSSPGYAKDNSKSYWEAHAKSWQGDVRASMQAPVTELSEEFGALRILRPNRDLRFSKDKTPYKTWQPMPTERWAASADTWKSPTSA